MYESLRLLSAAWGKCVARLISWCFCFVSVLFFNSGYSTFFCTPTFPQFTEHFHMPTSIPTNRRKKTERDVLWFKGCGMGPWLVLVSPCFRENVVATCKIGSFLCSLDSLLQKNVFAFFFGNQMSKWRSFEKRAIFDLLFTFFSQQGKVTKIPSAHISLTYIHVFC